ncbi:hypothetical protein GALMADRAFT_248899 [Galerina marginata CBS 339.88]|uniref:Uncharacterized protein n=1 Tax=Galerina marginata (strain CBS 339.88) TaxID=685588 RepID=A0A067T552_GALM3|nr:hypothetical protein GALMADRAFT_248899 [Galerina marginata CBS 339.88]
MSVASSVLSTRSSGWRINVRLASLMDSIFAITFGLGLRFVVDFVSRHDFKLTGTLVGLWEGVILLHFLKKAPKSSDPYIAYGVRLFIDFLFTESVGRLVLVLIWTALGMVLADITPAIWDDVGLNRTWRHFRRDLYTISRMIPTVAFFPPPRTVRFSPSREPSTIIAPDEPSVVSPPSAITSEQTPVTSVDPPPTSTARTGPRRPVPGYFPAEFSDTETDFGSVRGGTPGRTSRRLSVYPQRRDSNDTVSEGSSLSKDDDADDGNLSSTSSDSTEKGEPSLPEDLTQIPEMYTEDDILVDVDAEAEAEVVAAPTKPEEGELTPKQKQPIYMPPTPSDSAARWPLNRDVDDPLPVRPLSEFLPQIPDFLEEPGSEDWEKIRPEDYTDEKPPTPPAKDGPSSFGVPIVSAPVPPPAKKAGTPPQDDNMEGWDTMDSQFITRPDGNADVDAAATDDTQRHSQPPPYENNYDDIYDDPPPREEYDPASHETNLLNTDTNLIDIDAGVPPATAPSTSTGNGFSNVPPISSQFNFSSNNPWVPKSADAEALEAKKDKEAEEAAARQAEEDKQREDEERRKKEEQEQAEREAEEQRLKEEEAKRIEAEEKERVRLEGERKKKEKEERWQKELEDEAARKKKREEDAAAEAKRKQEEAERKGEEEAAQRKKDVEDAKTRRAEERKEKKAKDEAAAAEAKRLKEEEEKKKQEEAAQRKKDADDARARREEAERKRQEAEKARLLEEEEKRKAEAAKREEAERLKEEAKRKEEEAKLKVAEEAKKVEEEEAKRVEAERLKDEERRKEEETQKQQEQEEEDRRQKEAAEAEERRREEKQKEDEDSKKLQDEKVAKVDVAEVPEETPQVQVANDDVAQVPEPAANSSLEKPLPDHPPPEPTDDVIQVLVPDDVEEESVVSTASESTPEDVKDRLGRALTLRAQMVEIESRINDLGGPSGSSAELKALEKTLRKMQRQAERRYAAGIALAVYRDSNFDDKDDEISLENMHPLKAAQKVDEKIEELLKPSARSLHLTFTATKKAADTKRQKTTIIPRLESYNLTNFITENLNNKKISTIDVPEEHFADWLNGYRVTSTQQEQEDDDDDPWRRH